MIVDRMALYILDLVNAYIDWIKAKMQEEEAARDLLDGPEWAESEDRQEELLERLHNFEGFKGKIEKSQGGFAAHDIFEDKYLLRHLYLFAKPNTPTKTNNNPEVELPYEHGCYTTLGYWAAERLLPNEF
mgnify:CR=1 FL=1